MVSKTQIDRLGVRLKEASHSEDDLKLLDEYRRSFSPASEQVVRRLRDEVHLEPTARSAKSTLSVVEKLKRESVRLTQIQDIAGCRAIVRDVVEQDRVVAAL